VRGADVLLTYRDADEVFESMEAPLLRRDAATESRVAREFVTVSVSRPRSVRLDWVRPEVLLRDADDLLALRDADDAVESVVTLLLRLEVRLEPLRLLRLDVLSEPRIFIRDGEVAVEVSVLRATRALFEALP